MDSHAETQTINPDSHPESSLFVLPEGTLIADRYRIGRVLGTGGFAVVYAARDTHVRQDIALTIGPVASSGACPG